RMCEILLRKNKNNVLLLGEAGVGKTAMAEGLAQKIASGSIPALSGIKLYDVNMANVVAGTKYRGQFEERMKAIVKELSEDKTKIMFVDEIHTNLHAGDAEGGTTASNILKTALARGEIRLIGATTFKEDKLHIQKDSALQRRLQRVIIDELDPETSKQCIKQTISRYEEFHSVTYLPEAIESAVDL